MQTAKTILPPLAFLGVMGIAAGQAGHPVAPAQSPVTIAGYRHWTRINPNPHRVAGPIAYLCRGPTPEELADKNAGPHKDKFVTVYVNDTAKRAMLYQLHPVFPTGSIIVKEKLARTDSSQPELLTVMVKHESSYNLAGGGWEYRVYNGTGTHIQAQGRLQACQSCHAQWRYRSDFVSRAYFTDAMRRGLY